MGWVSTGAAMVVALSVGVGVSVPVQASTGSVPVGAVVESHQARAQLLEAAAATSVANSTGFVYTVGYEGRGVYSVGAVGTDLGKVSARLVMGWTADASGSVLVARVPARVGGVYYSTYGLWLRSQPPMPGRVARQVAAAVAAEGGTEDSLVLASRFSVPQWLQEQREQSSQEPGRVVADAVARVPHEAPVTVTREGAQTVYGFVDGSREVAVAVSADGLVDAVSVSGGQLPEWTLTVVARGDGVVAPVVSDVVLATSAPLRASWYLSDRDDLRFAVSEIGRVASEMARSRGGSVTKPVIAKAIRATRDVLGGFRVVERSRGYDVVAEGNKMYSEFGRVCAAVRVGASAPRVSGC